MIVGTTVLIILGGALRTMREKAVTVSMSHQQLPESPPKATSMPVTLLAFAARRSERQTLQQRTLEDTGHTLAVIVTGAIKGLEDRHVIPGADGLART
jgi:hypothetical protein